MLKQKLDNELINTITKQYRTISAAYHALNPSDVSQATFYRIMRGEAVAESKIRMIRIAFSFKKPATKRSYIEAALEAAAARLSKLSCTKFTVSEFLDELKRHSDEQEFR